MMSWIRRRVHLFVFFNPAASHQRGTCLSSAIRPRLQSGNHAESPPGDFRTQRDSLNEFKGAWRGGSRSGFTVYELLVIVGIMSILTGIVFSYTRRSEGQLALFRERAAIASAVLRAKGLAIQSFRPQAGVQPVCGYGIHVTRQDFTIFRELPTVPGGTTPTCAPTPDFYSGVSEEIERHTFNSRVALSICGDGSAGCTPLGGDTLDVLFIPPDPQVRFSPDQVGWNEFRLSITLLDQSSTFGDVVVNRAGQVSVGL